MNLNQYILSNSIKSYLIVFGILLFAFIIKRFVSRFFAKLIYSWIDKKNHSELRKSHVHRLVVPIERFLLFVIAIIAFYELQFPELWSIHIYKFSFHEGLESCVKLVFIILLIRVCLRTLEFVSIILEEKARISKDQNDDQLILFFRDFFKVILYIVGVLMVLHYVFNENIGNLVTSLSIVGAAIALSMRESLENIIASFIIFFDKPFTVGDLVKINNFTGTIEKIGLRSTRIRTDSKTYITVPNKQMVDSIVDNISLRTDRKIEMDLQLSIQTDAKSLMNFSNFLREKANAINDLHNTSVFVSESGKLFHVIHLETFVPMYIELSKYHMLREELNLAAISYANEHQIQFADTK